MAHFHKELTQEKWNSLSKDKQVLNILSELTRAMNWIQKNNKEYFQNSFDRGFELLDMAVNDQKWRASNCRELLRLREELGDYYIGNNNSVDQLKRLLRPMLLFTSETSQVQI